MLNLVQHDKEPLLLVHVVRTMTMTSSSVTLAVVHMSEVCASSRSACSQLGWVEQHDGRSRHEREQEGFQNEHGENARGEDSGSKTDIEDDELNQSEIGEIMICQFPCMFICTDVLTYPLQLIKLPIVLASRHEKPAKRAAIVHPPNLPE